MTQSMTQSITLVQITDTHLLDHAAATLRGCFPWHTLKAVLDQVSVESVDALILTGDLADQGSPAAYALLKQLVTPLQLPCYWIPGNHDHIPTLATSLSQDPFSNAKAFTAAGWRVILLNSVLADARWGEGWLPPQELRRLETELQRFPLPTLIILHHHVLPTGLDWLDQIQLQNAEQLFQTLDPYPQVRLILSGHVHLESHQLHNSVHVYSTPSTCLQVIPALSPPTPELQWPGYRLITLFPDGSHQTQVQRVEVAAGEPA